MTDQRIDRGFILLARKLESSEIMNKPPLYVKLWVWMLMQASHKDHGSLKRGQFFTTYNQMRRAMSWEVGGRIETPTTKQIRTAVDFLSEKSFVGRLKVTQGLVITILNYDFYQTASNYERQTEKSSKGTIKTRMGKEYTSEVQETFHYWRKVMGHPKAKLTADRRQKVRARLKEGYSLEDIRKAVDGCKASPHHMGQNDTGTIYDDLTLICRTGSKLEFFMNKVGEKQDQHFGLNKL